MSVNKIFHLILLAHFYYKQREEIYTYNLFFKLNLLNYFACRRQCWWKLEVWMRQMEWRNACKGKYWNTKKSLGGRGRVIKTCFLNSHFFPNRCLSNAMMARMNLRGNKGKAAFCKTILYAVIKGSYNILLNISLE